MKKLEGFVGEKYGQLLVTRDLGIVSSGGKRGMHYCECLCDCGRTTITLITSLRTGNTSACGNCKGATVKHGRKIFSCYHDMLNRCYNPKAKNYANYGARGISVCDEWKNSINGFDNFVKWSFKNGFDENLSIDRINNNDGYSPDNCRWATKRMQNINKRPGKPNKSGYIGIKEHSSGKGWYGSVKVKNKDFYTGYSLDIKEAARMRNDFILRNELENTLNEVV